MKNRKGNMKIIKGEIKMKKYVNCLVVLAIMLAIASVSYGRTLAEEAQAVRDYLNVVDAKLATAKQANNKARVDLLHVEKSASLARWYKLKASMDVAPAPVERVITKVITVPQQIAAQPVAKKSNGAFGWGLNTMLDGRYINTGKGSVAGSAGLMANVVLDDFIGLGSMFGMSTNAVKFKLGMGYYAGGGVGLKAIPVYAGGIINLPQWLGGQESFLTGGLNYVVDGNGQTSGKIGGDVFFGITADMGLGLGKTGFAIGYNVIRSNTVSSKGLSLSVSQPFDL
ncbi:MAG: hypothetical protein WCV91_02955 [Candidatus Margulisiibacteriota bacterium]